ncbi:MAG: hypothetical protein POG74_12670 [Acidocella sp.]|nr:hypothetical protein [Acidocella sp.]
MTGGFFQEPQHEFNTVGRYKYVSQDDDDTATPPRRERVWPPGFMLAFVLLVSVLLWIWIVGAFVFIRRHFG